MLRNGYKICPKNVGDIIYEGKKQIRNEVFQELFGILSDNKNLLTFYHNNNHYLYDFDP